MTMTEPLTLDVREILRSGGEPLPKIMQAVGRLAPGQPLRLLVTFEPLPLYAVLGRKGFEHSAVRHGEGDWEVLFAPRGAEAGSGAAAVAAVPHTSSDEWPMPSAVLDNRGLSPPEPMMRILEALEHLAPGQVLEALNEREPVFLYPELQARGAVIHTETVGEGVRLLIRCAG